MRIAIKAARQVNPNIAIGICGEVRDPSSPPSSKIFT